MRRAAALLALALGLTACGGGDQPAGVVLTITRDFGAKPIVQLQAAPERDDTAVALLRRHAKVDTGPGGVVRSIDGLGSGGAAHPAVWSLYVNGVEVLRDAASTTIHDGDRVWWDRQPRAAATGRRIAVGAFPEPFLHGVDGKRLPVRVECSDPQGAPCRQVVERLAALDIPAARGIVRGPRTQDTLRVLVGPWPALRGDEALAQLERGPRASGVDARPTPDGTSIVALDASGAEAGSFGAGTGLVAATRFGEEQPVWVVTGTDTVGLAAAARAFNESSLGHKLAVVVSDGVPLALPRPSG